MLRNSLRKMGMGKLTPKKTKTKEQSRFVNLFNRSNYCHYTYNFFSTLDLGVSED